MKFNIKIATVPSNNPNALSYFTYKNISIEAEMIRCDELFGILLLEIPELGDMIINYFDNHHIESIFVESYKVPFDFSNHEDMHLYYKLSNSSGFDSL